MVNIAVDRWNNLVDVMVRRVTKSSLVLAVSEHWEPPPRGVFNVNVDASLVDENLRGLGVVIL